MDASKQSPYGPTCSDTVEMHSVEIIMKNSVKKKLFLVDGQEDRQTGLILRTHLKTEFSFKLPASTRGFWNFRELRWKFTRLCPVRVTCGVGFVWCWNFHFGKYIWSTWKVLKCGTGEGCVRSFGPIVWKIKKHYIESRAELLTYDNK
jgi:hypothetical protein